MIFNMEPNTGTQASDVTGDDRDFQSSELGTKQFWDDVYIRDLDNYNNSAEVGDIWFGEESQMRVVRWLEEDCEDVDTQDAILDLGCGNGMMLVELHREGYRDLTGVDYSETAVQLARNIADKEGMADIKYETADLTTDVREGALTCRCGHYKMCVDKGTYDAISLIPDNALTARRTYQENIKHLLRADGLFVITSCNWTCEQLEEFFSTDFSLESVIPTPTFQFGGKTGNTVTSLVFKPKS
ncbi:EEF1A lysine methyltransferase 2-like [Haliotis rufescens]|uniref:EEF1A lysine methyltransferase 2-like n=1 Tax=Haliotis rufescens TaxID=6454 RepID=UPI00201F309D|nr:EEF1A lysine methyltransferase 2-like [Haliotis rufescens]